MKFVKNCKTFALTGALALLLAGCGSTAAEMSADVDKAITTSFPMDFAKLEFEERNPRLGLHPAVVFEGKNATILAVSKPKKWVNFMAPDEVKMSGIALTQNGRYLQFTYRSPLLAPAMPVWATLCVEDGCRYFEQAQAVSRASAMQWFFDSDTPERVRDLFAEEAPSKRTEA